LANSGYPRRQISIGADFLGRRRHPYPQKVCTSVSLPHLDDLIELAAEKQDEAEFALGNAHDIPLVRQQT
tara:strand:- start:363 stop:572 length:210 start_codon:yes stop_codon:yes gene_type:complete